jgi:LysM repeat protein
LAGFIRNRGRIELEPVLQFDPDLAQQNLAGLSPQFEIPAQPATLRLFSGRVEAVPAVTGQTLDIPTTVAQVAQNPARLLGDGHLRLVMQPVAATLTDVSGPAAQANQLLAQPLALKAYDPINNETITWYYEPAEWGAWLSLAVKADDPGQLDWSLDTDKVRTALTERSAELGLMRFLDLEGAVAEVAATLTAGSWSSWLRIFHHEQQHVVKAGETLSSIGYDYGLPYPWLEQANPNVGQALRPGQVLTIPSPDVLLPLPVVKNKRIVVSLGEQKMWAYEAGLVKWEWPVSTGITASPTAPGVFQVQTHEPRAYAENWNLWMPNFMGIYRPVPTLGFMNGFHGFPTRNGATLLWTGDLGHPVTYGCILLSSDNAATLYDWAEAGVVVEVRR